MLMDSAPILSVYKFLKYSVRCFKQIWKVGKVGEVGKVGKVGREGLIMPTWKQL